MADPIQIRALPSVAAVDLPVDLSTVSVPLDPDVGATSRLKLSELVAAVGGGGASLSNATPAALGTASAGVAATASRSDHVHARPTAIVNSEVDAAAAIAWTKISKTGAVKGDVGLGNVDNTADSAKPVSTAQAAADAAVLAAAAPAGRTVSTTAPLTGGGDLSANRTLAVSAATTSAVGVVELATNGETAASVVVQGNDGRLSKSIGYFTPESGMFQPASSFALFDTRNGRPVYSFTDAVTLGLNIRCSLPEQANLASGLKLRLRLAGATATSGVMRFGGKVERCNTDADTDSFATAVEADATANGTSGIPTVLDITITTIDSAVAGDEILIQFYRNGAHANDTMTGAAQVISAEVFTAA